MSEKFVMVGDQLVPWPKVAAARRERAEAARSGLPAPMIISDHLDGVQNPCDGKTYDSKSAYYRAVRDAGCEIVGNEAEKIASSITPARSEVTKDEVANAVRKVESGYKPKVDFVKEFENYGTD